MAGQPEGAPRRKDAERNRRRLLAAAREVFRDRGVAATLNDVAHHAGLGVGTVYRHFANKEVLIDALFEDMVETVDQYVREAAAEPDAWLGLTRALQQVCEVQAFDRGLREVLLGTGRGPERQQQMRERVGPTVDVLVARAQEQGTLRAEARGRLRPGTGTLAGPHAHRGARAHHGRTEVAGSRPDGRQALVGGSDVPGGQDQDHLCPPGTG